MILISPYAYVGMKDPISVVGGEATAKLICEVVAEYFGISFEQMKTRTRSRRNNIMKSRQIAMYLIREKTSLSFNGIAELFGGFDHTTIIAANKVVQNYIDTEEDYRNEIELIKIKLQTNYIDNDTRIKQIKKKERNNNNYASSR